MSKEDMAKEDMAAISAEIGKLREDLSGMVESLSRIARERAETIARSEPLSQGLAAGEAALNDIAAELRALESDITRSTRRSPWRALGIAALVGLVIGFLLGR